MSDKETKTGLEGLAASGQEKEKIEFHLKTALGMLSVEVAYLAAKTQDLKLTAVVQLLNGVLIAWDKGQEDVHGLVKAFQAEFRAKLTPEQLEKVEETERRLAWARNARSN